MGVIQQFSLKNWVKTVLTERQLCALCCVSNLSLYRLFIFMVKMNKNLCSAKRSIMWPVTEASDMFRTPNTSINMHAATKTAFQKKKKLSSKLRGLDSGSLHRSDPKPTSQASYCKPHRGPSN